MTRPHFFIIASVVIFAIERALPTLVSWPVFIFPVFAILFLLTSKADTHDLSYVAVASIFFDFFSGLVFGFTTLAILVVGLTIFLAKKIISIDRHSTISTFIFSLIFTTEYILLSSLGSSAGSTLSNWLFLLVETATVSMVVILVSKMLEKFKIETNR